MTRPGNRAAFQRLRLAEGRYRSSPAPDTARCEEGFLLLRLLTHFHLQRRTSQAARRTRSPTLERFAGAALPSQPSKSILSQHFTFNGKCSLSAHREALGRGGDEEARKKHNRQEIKAFYSVPLSYSNCAAGSVKVRSSSRRRASKCVRGSMGIGKKPCPGMKGR